MEIKIKFTAQLKDIVGQGVDKITLEENEKIQSVLLRLSDRYGEKFKSILFDASGLYRNSILLVLNQYQINYEDNVVLNDGDEIAIMSPISGG